MLQIRWRVIYTLSLLLVIYSILGISFSKSANADENAGKKIIILVLDAVTLEEIVNSNAPNIDLLVKNGAIGHMNIRGRSSLSNRGSTYLSLGMGVRTIASKQGGQAFDRNERIFLSKNNLVTQDFTVSHLYDLYTGRTLPDGEVINIAIGDIERIASAITPNNLVGLLGKRAKDEDLVIGVLGNSDVNASAREVTMLAMDENGAIPFGSVGDNLLTADASVLGGIKLNQDRLIEETERILPNVDILFIDYGDTARIQEANQLATEYIRREQKAKAIERADSFLGQVIKKVDLEKTLFMVITPNPSRKMIDQGNFGLTPVIMSGSHIEKGLLTSNTTRREGLVANFDFGPTVFNFFGAAKSAGFIGEPMKVVSHENPTQVILSNQEQFLYLREYRGVFHWSYIGLVGITLVGLYLPRFTKWKGLPDGILSYLGLTVIAIPLMMMTVSFMGYKSIILDIFYVFIGAFLVSYSLNKIFKQNFLTIAILGLATSLLLLIDIYLGRGLMIISPLGSDAVAGGRFYGIGNDYMGILLGSTLLGIFSLFSLYKINKAIMVVVTTFYMVLVIVALSPFFGANMGGTLSALVITLLALLMIFNIKLSLKKVTFIIIGVSMGIIGLAILDALFNPNPTHAGKALESIIIGGWSRFIEVIYFKLSLVIWNLVNASWNIILFLQVVLTVILYKYKRNSLIKISESYPNLFKGFMVILLGGVVIFLFNDTGTIAASLILTYLFIPLAYRL